MTVKESESSINDAALAKKVDSSKDHFQKDQDLLDWLKPVQDPELFLSLVDLGLIYECIYTEPTSVCVKMSLTSPSCPAAGYLVDQVKKRILERPGVLNAQVDLIFEPKWDPKTMASDECKERMGIW